MPDLGGKGVWIRHDGLNYEIEGRRVSLDGMRAPFKVGKRADFSSIKVNDRIAFKFAPRSGPGFAFEVTEVRLGQP